jgi:hypothetical protein
VTHAEAGATRTALVTAGAASLVMLLTRGLQFGVSDHSMLIPIVRHLRDANAYAGDYLLGALRGGYSTFFYVLVAACCPSDAAVRALFRYGAWPIAAAAFVLVALACRRQRLVPAETLVACGMLALGYNPSLGHSFFDLSLTHAMPGILMGLAALALFEYGYPVVAFAIGGLMLNIHGMYALHIVVVLALASLLKPRGEWRWAAAGMGLAVVLGLPALVAQARAAATGVPIEEWASILRVRDALHIFVRDVPPRDWVAFAAFLAILAGPWGDLRDGRERATLLVPAGLLAVLGIVGALLFVEWHPVGAALRLAPLRATFWLYLIGLPLWARSVTLGLARPATAIATAVLLAGIVQEPLSLQLLGLLYVLGALVVRRLAPAREGFVAGVYVAAVVAVLLGRPFMGALGIPPPAVWPLTGPHTVVIPAIAGIVALAQVSGRRSGHGSALPALAMGTIAAFACLQALRARDGALVREQPREWIDVQDWARRVTAPEATFIVPVDQEGFRIGSWRAQYVDWKDGTLGNFNADFARDWYARMRSLGIGFSVWNEPERARQAYRDVDLAVTCAIAARTPVRYLIAEDPRQMEEMPLAYANGRYYVREIVCPAADVSAAAGRSALPHTRP